MIEEVVAWYEKYKTYAYVLHEGAHVSLIRFTYDGIDHEIAVDNNEIDIRYRMPIVGYEVDNGM